MTRRRGHKVYALDDGTLVASNQELMTGDDQVGPTPGKPLTAAALAGSSGGSVVAVGRKTAVQVASNCSMPNRDADAGRNGHTSGNYTWFHKFEVDTAGNVRVWWSSIGRTANLETVESAENFSMKASAVLPNGVLVPLTFGGSATRTVAPGDGRYGCDPIPGFAPTAGDWIKVIGRPANPNGKWPASTAPAPTPTLYDADGTDGSGTYTDSFNNPYLPCGVSADTVAPVDAVANIGDSIGRGEQSDSAMNSGAAERALGSAGVPLVNVSSNSITLEGFNTANTYELAVIAGCTTAILARVTNDLLQTAPVASLATLQARALTAATTLLTVVQRVVVSTPLPISTGTSGAQTSHSSNATRVLYANWLRGGAPIDPSSKAAVAVGAAGALLAGSTGHPFSATFEAGAHMETVKDSGVWIAAYFADGTHPNEQGYRQLARVFPVELFGGKRTKGTGFAKTAQGNYPFQFRDQGDENPVGEGFAYALPFLYSGDRAVAIYNLRAKIMATGAASTRFRLMVYEYPSGRLILDGGTLDGTVLSPNDGAIATHTVLPNHRFGVLKPMGRYWIGGAYEGPTSVTRPGVRAAVGFNSLMAADINNLFTEQNNHFRLYHDRTFTAAPALQGGLAGKGGYCPLVTFNVAAEPVPVL